MIDAMFIPFLVFIFGTIIGSFLNVVIYRVPLGKSITFPHSKCQACETTLKPWHNIPIVSWLVLGGKCYFCKEKISLQYPMVEFLTGIIYLLLLTKTGLVWYFPFIAFSFSALFAFVMIDFKYMAAPDSINILALLFALVQSNFFTGLLNASLAAGGLYLLGRFTSFFAKKQVLGGGDVIIAGTMGALLGFPNFFVALFLSAILAVVPALFDRENGVPFVPFLAMATFLVYIYDVETAEILNDLTSNK